MVEDAEERSAATASTPPALDDAALARLAAAGMEAGRVAFARWLVGHGLLTETLSEAEVAEQLALEESR